MKINQRPLVLLCSILLIIQSCSVTATAKNDQSKRTILFLIDATTQYDALDQSILMSGVDQLYKSLEIGDRLLADTVPKQLSPFSRYYPGCSSTGFFSGCSEGRVSHDRIAFQSNLKVLLTPILESHPPEDLSPIIRTIQQRIIDLSIGKKISNLVIFSDLYENSSGFLWPAIIREPVEPLLEKLDKLGLIPNLHGVDVQVFGFSRTHDPSRRSNTDIVQQALTKFWKAFFARAGATRVLITQEFHGLLEAKASTSEHQ